MNGSQGRMLRRHKRAHYSYLNFFTKFQTLILTCLSRKWNFIKRLPKILKFKGINAFKQSFWKGLEPRLQSPKNFSIFYLSSFTQIWFLLSEYGLASLLLNLHGRRRLQCFLLDIGAILRKKMNCILWVSILDFQERYYN